MLVLRLCSAGVVFSGKVCHVMDLGVCMGHVGWTRTNLLWFLLGKAQMIGVKASFFPLRTFPCSLHQCIAKSDSQ